MKNAVIRKINESIVKLNIQRAKEGLEPTDAVT